MRIENRLTIFANRRIHEKDKQKKNSPNYPFSGQKLYFRLPTIRLPTNESSLMTHHQ